MKIIKEAKKKTYERDGKLSAAVSEIIENVKQNGDAALKEYAARFDHMEIDTVRVSRETVEAAYRQLDQETIDTIRFSAGQIKFFAEKQLECLKDLDIESRIPGLRIGHRMIPVERCGCYVPAGRHPLPSSALMGIVTAKVAGVKSVAACSPAYAGAGTIHPAVLVAMDIAGADEIYCMGGAQAIAAYAYGTETVKKTDLIVGPGNRFVTEAKRQVLGDVGIDSLAGPSEVLIIADETAKPDFVAIDLLSQAEHDPDAKAVLVTTSEALAKEAEAKLYELLKDLPTRETAEVSWENNGAI
ncbi:MAG: histidinol dehydrogenase, partial [Verrucomicrobia bacterium]|nr:histidinol dehydrogenase [Verrucomicrobiota bacterium]